VTSGAVRRGSDAGRTDAAPFAAPVVTVGRPGWRLMALAAAITVAVSVDLLGHGWLLHLDLRVSRVVDGWDLRHGHAYWVVWLFTQLGGRGFIVAVLAVLAGWLAWRRRTLVPVIRVLVALALLTGVIYAFKYGMGRTAPEYPGSFFHRDGSSFPSGHVANAVLMWGLARWLAVEYGLAPALQRLFAVLSIAGPVAAGLAMVALNFHWVTDAVVGGAVGVLLLGVVHTLDAAALSLWVRARAGRDSA
jgi:membrane-associated phospholipid phosphatase